MSSAQLLAFFDARSDDPSGLVLASVYDTLGSTYSKTGARMLITGDGDFQGMLSGGCLEGDLAERARHVAHSGTAQRITYDLRSSAEELWGLGVGCEGLMRILLQRLSAATDFSPWPAMAAIWRGDEIGILATVIESDDPATPVGAALWGTASGFESAGITAAALPIIESAARSVLDDDRSEIRTFDIDDRSIQVLFGLLRPPPRILVLGGGLDAQPLVNLCAEMGWRVTVQDHRPAYVERGDFSAADAVHCLPAAAIAEALDLDRFDAAIAMSHHLDTDRIYLRLLAPTAIRYLGLLGPRERRNRLMEEVGELRTSIEARLHGPAGLDIGGRGPASIALSIVAEMHQVLLDGVDGN